MIEEVYISFDTAKMLDGIEFHCVGCYTENGSVDALDVLNAINNKEKLYPRITQSLLARWLREKRNMCVEVYCIACGFIWNICKTDGTGIKSSEHTGPNNDGAWDTYEEAMEDGLQAASILIK